MGSETPYFIPLNVAVEISKKRTIDIKSEKVTVGKNANLEGSIASELVVISGNYQGKIKADSVWLTDTSVITGEINYKSLQMDMSTASICTKLQY